MSYKVSSFSVGASLGIEIYINTILNGIANSLVSCSSNWEISGEISKVNNISIKYKTIQVHNTISGEYIRFWCCASEGSTSYSASVVSQDTQTTSVGSTGLYVHKNNLLGYLDASFAQKYYAAGFLFFGVSNSSIGEDPGLDLGLKFPLTCIGGISNNNSGYAVTSSIGSFHAAYSVHGYSVATTFYVVSDGIGFYLIRTKPSVASASSLVAYHKDAINTMSGDNYKSLVFKMGDSRYGGEIPTVIQFAFQDSTGGYNNLSGIPGVTRPTDTCLITQTSTKLMTVPAMLYENTTYSGSTGSGVKDGLCYKGNTNFDFIRCCNTQVITDANIGATYMGGTWMHIAMGILIPWESGKPTPFE